MTHTGTLDLAPLGVRAFVPTGKPVKLPPESATVIVRDRSLACWANVTPPDGGWLVLPGRSARRSAGPETSAPRWRAFLPVTRPAVRFNARRARLLLQWPGAESNCRHADFQSSVAPPRVRQYRPVSDTTRYHISTSAAATGRRCADVCSRCFVFRGTIGGQSPRTSQPYKKVLGRSNGIALTASVCFTINITSPMDFPCSAAQNTTSIA
jgi:hypothetical protein